MGGSYSMHESQLRRGRSGEPGLGRRAGNEARAEVEKVGQAPRAQALLGCVKRKGERSVRWEGTRFLYHAKAAAGPCSRLAKCGGHGFLMRACHLVFYYYNIATNYFVYILL
jgi:hypothetical protein